MISKVNEATSQMVKIIEKNTVYKNNRQGIRSVMLQLKMLEDGALEQIEIINDMIKDIQSQCQHKKVRIFETWDYPDCEDYYIVECKDCGLEIERLFDIDDHILKHYGLKI